PHPVVFEVSEAEGLATDELHFVVEAFGDAVVAAEAPHGGDLTGPGMQRVAELHQLRQASLPQLVDGAEEAWRQLGALFASAVFLQQQVAQPLFEEKPHSQTVRP